MAEQRQRARRVLQIGGDHFGEAVFDGEPAAAGRLVHGPQQVRLGQWSEQHLAGGEPVGELVEDAELAVEIGPHGDDQPAGVGDDGVHERRLFGRIVAQA